MTSPYSNELDAERRLEVERIKRAVCVICGKTIGDRGSTRRGTEHVHIDCLRKADTRESKACAACGYQRVVKVAWRWEGGSELKPYWNNYCEACLLDNVALSLRDRAAAAARKAKAIREKRRGGQ
jgi:DNA-directed RNA polymerase subunit RPC12/RpoP